jgi:prevent-host-death family protein
MDRVVNIHEAKTHLSRLLALVEAGEVITIARAGRPIAVLTRAGDDRKDRVPGYGKGEVVIHDDFDDPIPELEAYF